MKFTVATILFGKLILTVLKEVNANSHCYSGFRRRNPDALCSGRPDLLHWNEA